MSMLLIKWAIAIVIANFKWMELQLKTKHQIVQPYRLQIRSELLPQAWPGQPM